LKQHKNNYQNTENNTLIRIVKIIHRGRYLALVECSGKYSNNKNSLKTTPFIGKNTHLEHVKTIHRERYLALGIYGNKYSIVYHNHLKTTKNHSSTYLQCKKSDSLDELHEKNDDRGVEF
jgi:hypothetical protein